MLWLVVAAQAAMFTGVFIPGAQSSAASSPECDYAVLTVLTQTLPFSIHTLPEARLRSCAWVLTICRLVQKHANFVWVFFFFLEADVSALWPILLSASNCSTTDALCVTPAAPWWESAIDFSSAFCSQVMRMWSCDKQTVWAVGGGRPAACVVRSEPVGGNE